MVWVQRLSNKVSLDLTLHKYIKFFQNRPRRPKSANLELLTEFKIFSRILCRTNTGKFGWEIVLGVVEWGWGYVMWVWRILQKGALLRIVRFIFVNAILNNNRRRKSESVRWPWRVTDGGSGAGVNLLKT